MKILYFTKYSRNAGSSRLRSFQYFPYLEKAGFEVEASPLFSENYLVKLYAGESTLKEAVVGYGKRLLQLFAVRKYDHIVIEKELFPYLPAFAERLLTLRGRKYIVDYDDAIFHNYDQSAHPVIKGLLGKKIDTVMANAAVVVAGNSYLAERAVNAGAKVVEVIPTVIDLERYPVKSGVAADQFVLGWIGTKSTFEKHLLPCRTWLKEAQRRHPELDVHIVGITDDMDLGPRVSYIPWSEETEVQEILKMDVGIMPLQDSVWEKGKCAYKLIQYAACGIPGIASDVGMNNEVCVDGETGLLSRTDKQWMESITSLKTNIALRKQLGANARKRVEAKYCIQVTSQRWIKLLST